MTHFTEIGRSYEEAEFLVRQKHGLAAQITGRQTISRGGFLGIGRKIIYEISGYVKNIPKQQYTESLPDSIQKAKKDIINASGVSDSATMVKILDHVRELRKEVQENSGAQSSEHPNIAHIDQLLTDNEFSPAYKRHIQAKIRELSVNEIDDPVFLQRRVLSWISQSIRIMSDIPTASPRIMVLVGPTGVGKTTTIAKLAGLCSSGKLNGKQHSVRIIASDHYRIGALKQLETYAEIMQVPIESASQPDELKKHISLFQNSDIIFIDTPGRSPNDFENIARLNSFLQSSGARLEVYLTLCTASMASNIKRIIQQFEPFNITSTIITKTDEVMSLGSIISALWEKNKDISYISYGQGVPNDLKLADREHFLRGLSGFLTKERSTAQVGQKTLL